MQYNATSQMFLSLSPVSRIVSKEGVAALYSGLVPGLQRQMAFSAIRIGRQQYTYHDISLHPYCACQGCMTVSRKS